MVRLEKELQRDGLVLLGIVEPRQQNSPGFGPVLMLALFVAHVDGDARGLVTEPHC